MNQEQVLSYLQENSKPSINEILHCSDVFDVYKSGNQQLLQILLSPDGISQIITILRNCTEPPIVERILRMFSISKSPLLSEIANSNEYTEDLTKGLDDAGKVHPYVTGVITQILEKSLETYPGDFYESLNSSKIIFTLLVKHVEVNSVYYLCTSIVESSTEAQTFAWFLFVSLMGEHGPGCAVPKVCTYEPASSVPYYPLTQTMRKKVLELLFSFFSQFPDACDFYNEISIALPLMLQDAADDEERAIVFKLGLSLNSNDSMVRAAMSVLECMKSSDILLQYAMYYIQSFSRNMSNSSIELILYRMLHRPPNNFLLIVLGRMIQAVIGGSNFDRSDLSESLQMIIADALQNKTPPSFIMRAIRMFLCCSAEGDEIDPESTEAVEQLKRFEKDPNIMEIDPDYIKQLKKKADLIASSKTITPTYTVAKLWERNYKKMEEKFKNLGARPLFISTPDEEQKPQKKRALSLPRAVPAMKNIQSFSAHAVQEEEDLYSSDDYYDEESTDELEAQKMRATIERQQAAKEQAEKTKEKEEQEIIEAPVKETVSRKSQHKSSSSQPTHKAAETTTKGKGKKGKTSKKGKGKGKSKKGKSAAQKPHLSFSMNVGVVDAPPEKPHNQQLELNISSVKLRPRKAKPVFDRKVLVIDCPLKKPSLEISPSNKYEIGLTDAFMHYQNASPRQTLTKEDIRKLVEDDFSDSEEDFDIEPLPSEMEEDSDYDDDEIQRSNIKSSLFPLSINKSILLQEEESYEEELEEDK